MARSAHRGEAVLIAVTGASGYVGAHCVAEAIRRGHRVVAISTQPANKALVPHRDQLEWHYVADYHALNRREWTMRLQGVTAVIHCAARVHQTDRDALAQMHRDNAELTETIVNAAIDAQVPRFAFLSSAAVYGDATNLAPFSINAQLKAGTDYALSKLKAEQILIGALSKSGIEINILRPAVVYGERAPGNMTRLARMVAKGWPLPFGAIHNRRSIASIRTLVNAIFWCIERELTNQVSIWNVADREPISTTRIVNAISRGLERPKKNFAIPPAILRRVMQLVGQGRVASQLIESWQLDVSDLVDAGFNEFADTEFELEALGRSLLR